MVVKKPLKEKFTFIILRNILLTKVNINTLLHILCHLEMRYSANLLLEYLTSNLASIEYSFTIFDNIIIV